MEPGCTRMLDVSQQIPASALYPLMTQARVPFPLSSSSTVYSRITSPFSLTSDRRMDFKAMVMAATPDFISAAPRP